MKNLVLVLCEFALFYNVNSARILCSIGTPSFSHQVFFQPLWKALALRGHDVVVITPFPTDEKIPHFREISTHETYDYFKRAMDMMVNYTFIDLLLENKMMEASIYMMNQSVHLPQVQALVKDETQQFDLMILEHMMSPYFGLKKKYKCPLIGVTSFDAMPNSHRIMGNAVHSVLYPSGLLPKPDSLTFRERLMAIIYGNIFDLLLAFPPLIRAMDKIVRDGLDVTAQDVIDGFEDADMLFVNTNPVLVPVRPHTPSTVSVAGMHMTEPKPLPKELKDFLDVSKEGVIYFSFGSNVKSNLLSLELRQVIMETLKQVPYKVLYKHEDDTLPGKPDNVRLLKWGPQQDILRHKNVKLFITQGGIQSLEEAFYLSVPTIVIPFFGDQLPNAEKIKQKGLGIALDRYNLSVGEFKAAIIEAITNPSYRKALQYWAGLVQDDPMTPLERAVWWTEYVLRHKGAKHLRGPKIPFYQYYYLDISIAIGGVILLLLTIIAYMIKSSCKWWDSRKKAKTSKTKIH